MGLIKLLADPDDDTLPPPPPLLRGAEFPIDDLLLEVRARRQRAKRREAAFLSVLVHLGLIVLLLLSPKIFGTVPVARLPQPDLQQQPQLTYLEMPKDLITPKPKTPPKPKALSDQDRTFKNPAPVTNSISAPVTAPKPAPTPGTPPPGRPEPQPPSPPRPAPGAPANAVAATPKPAPEAQPAPKPNTADSGLHLLDVPKPVPAPKLKLNLGAAQQLQNAIAGAARDGARHSPGIAETAPLPHPPSGTPNAAPGQTGAGVQILTDTQGVDFDPYLRRVVEIVRRNWYAVMPETVYLGTKGRVVLVFNINANGTVPGLKVVSLSGTNSLDQAAEASISASNPFPPLPSQFHGPFITLQFSFYYNLSPPSE